MLVIVSHPPYLWFVWFEKAKQEIKENQLFFFCPCLYVVLVYMLVTFTLPMIFFCFCFFVFGCEPMICLKCERKRGYHCQGKYDVFLYCPYFERERENSSHFGQCLLYRYFWVHLWPLALQVRFFFNQRLIIVHVGWAHEGVKHWPRKFFSKCR